MRTYASATELSRKLQSTLSGGEKAKSSCDFTAHAALLVTSLLEMSVPWHAQKVCAVTSLGVRTRDRTRLGLGLGKG